MKFNEHFLEQFKTLGKKKVSQGVEELTEFDTLTPGGNPNEIKSPRSPRSLGKSKSISFASPKTTARKEKKNPSLTKNKESLKKGKSADKKWT